MGLRRKQRSLLEDLLDAVAILPWPVGVGLGLAGFPIIKFGLFPWLAGSMAIAFSWLGTLFAVSWLAVCLLGALASGNRSKSRRKLLDTRTNLESLSANGWKDFERLVGEAFRRQGYAVDENDHAGPDGGIDLVLRKDGLRTLVQCKQWRRQQVGVAIVREMYGLLVHHHADAVKIVSTGSYTEAAEAFAVGKPIELVNGEQLLAMIRLVQATQPATSSESVPSPRSTKNAAESFIPPCPRCGAQMVERHNRRSGIAFMGCSRFPACRGTVP